MFKLVNSKHKAWASVRNDSLSLNLLVAKLKYVNSMSVKVKATEVYLLWMFCKKNIKLLVINKEGKL